MSPKKRKKAAPPIREASDLVKKAYWDGYEEGKRDTMLALGTGPGKFLYDRNNPGYVHIGDVQFSIDFLFSCLAGISEEKLGGEK